MNDTESTYRKYRDRGHGRFVAFTLAMPWWFWFPILPLAIATVIEFGKAYGG